MNGPLVKSLKTAISSRSSPLHQEDVCTSATEIPHWWRKICPKSGQELLLVNIVVIIVLAIDIQTTVKKLRQAVPIFGAKLWNGIPGRMRDTSKKVCKRKLISVLFKILKDKDDNLDATMITREIKLQNPKPQLLSQVAFNRFDFLAFEFITHIYSFLFSLLFAYFL